MGAFNSSVTRVWPVFDWLFRKDPSGRTWLGPLLAMGSRAKHADSLVGAPGALHDDLALFDLDLPGPFAKVLGRAQCARLGKIRRAFEKELAPPTPFLRWMIEHPLCLTWPRTAKGGEEIFGSHTQEKRKRLMTGDLSILEQAVGELARIGAAGSRRRWWAFEGFTSVDCYLETESLIVLVEGKRTESISASTAWYPRRNQLVRNVEVAQTVAKAKGKAFAVLMLCERPPEDFEENWLASLPHLCPAEIDELQRHYLGHALWADVAEALCAGLGNLPNTVSEAIAVCCRLREQRA